MEYLFPTMAAQIALSSPVKRQTLEKILYEDPYILDRAAGSVQLIVRLLETPINVLHALGSALSPSLVIIDGLDECHGTENQVMILTQIRDLVREHHVPLRFLILSRPEPHIRDTFAQPALKGITKVISLYGDHGSRKDVLNYLRHEFTRIHDSDKHKDTMTVISEPWPSEDILKLLVKRSGGYFIYASTVVKFVDEENFRPIERLNQVLGVSNSSSHPDSAAFAELDKLYTEILTLCPRSNIPLLKRILGYRALARRFSFPFIPLIEKDLGLQPGQIKLTLRQLHSIVSFESHITGEESVPLLQFIHASFLDFLFDENRSGEYYIDRQQWYEDCFRDIFIVACDVVGLSETSRGDKRSALNHAFHFS